MGKLFSDGPLLEKGASTSSETTFFQKKATPSNSISVACLQRRLFSQIHESWEEAMASTACPFRTGGKKDVFSTLASLFAFSRASFSNSVQRIRVYSAWQGKHSKEIKGFKSIVLLFPAFSIVLWILTCFIIPSFLF